jgi:hypothetical protein
MISTVVNGWKVRTFLNGKYYHTEIYGQRDGKYAVLQYSQPTLTATTFYFDRDYLLRLVAQRHLDVCKNVRRFIGFE